jgi:hypothetical protein
MRSVSALVIAFLCALPPAILPAAGADSADAASAAAPSASAPSASGDPAGQPRYELYFDPFVSEETGAQGVASAVTFLGAAEERLDWLAGGRAGGAGAVALRSVRLLVWDAPVAWWFGVALHETFGHGGRAREFNASPGVHLGTPWQGRVSLASFDGTGKSNEELLYIYAGGTEANTLAATLLERRAVEGVRLRPIDLLFLASNRLVESRYVLRTTPDPRRHPAAFYQEYGGGDVARYLGYLHELHGDGTGITPTGVDDEVDRQYRRLRRQAWWNALDPGTWWAISSALRMTARGDDSAPLPLPRAGRFRFLPVLSSQWTPSGGVASFELVLAPDGGVRDPAAARDPAPARDAAPASAGRRLPPWFSFVARRGRGPSGPIGALGAAADDIITAGRLSFGGMMEVWHDPRNGLGGGALVRARFLRGSLAGLYFDLGVKSQGYWIGQPAVAGPYAAIGLRFGP